MKLEVSTWSILKITGILLLIYFLFVIKDILIMLTASFIFSAALEPVIDRIELKFKLPRWTGVLLVYATLIVLVYLFISIIFPVLSEQIRTLVANRETYLDSVNSFISSFPKSYQEQIQSFIHKFPTDIKDVPLNGLYQGVFGLFSGLAGILIVFVISFYILSLKNGMKKTLSDLLPKSRQNDFIKVFGLVGKKINQWVVGQLFLSFIVGLVTFSGLWIMNVPYAMILAIFAAFTELIPIIGPFLGAIPAIIVAFFVSPWLAVLVALFYLFVQQAENHILVPQVMKRAVGLNPIIVIIVMLIGGKLLGIIGILLAIPVASAANVIINQWPTLEGRKNGNR